MLTGHSAAATGTAPRDAAAGLAGPPSSAPAPSPSARSTTWQPKPPKWTPGDPRRSAPPDWGWPG
jgi:hypothetical protein